MARASELLESLVLDRGAYGARAVCGVDTCEVAVRLGARV
jgi:hypothetical protein